nr:MULTISPECIES: histidine phosphatase family protein [unclassified Acidovorax]
MLEIYLVRHGETAWSLSGQHTGHTEVPLTEHGESQARALAQRLGETVFTHILVSPRLRARQTCALAGCAAASEIEPDLAEWDYGDYEGLRSEDIRKARPDWNVWRDGCPHGEMPAHVSIRANRLIARLCTLQGRVALFSHAQFGAALAVRWIGLPLDTGQHFALFPASVSVLGHASNHPATRVVALWNETPAV